MANTLGRVYRFGSPATLALYNSAGSLVVTLYTSPDMEGYDLQHECDTDEVRNSSGEVVGHITYNNRITLTVNFIPAGANANDALKALSAPDANGTCVITGAPQVQFGSYEDAINAPGTPGTGPGGRWIYAGGASLKFTQSGKATGTITLKRYSGMGVTVTGAAISI
jgi:hypothetical protein